MIYANRWIEWAVRGVVYAALFATALALAGVTFPVTISALLKPAVGSVMIGFLLLGVIECRFRRHWCWAVTDGYDFEKLRAFFRVDPAHRFLPLPSQRSAYLAGLRMTTKSASPQRPKVPASAPAVTAPAPATKTEPPPPPLPALAALTPKAPAPAPAPKPTSEPISVSSPVPETPPAPAVSTDKTDSEAPAAPTAPATPKPIPLASPVPDATPPPATIKAPSAPVAKESLPPPTSLPPPMPAPADGHVSPQALAISTPPKPVSVEKNGSTPPSPREKTNATPEDLPAFPS